MSRQWDAALDEAAYPVPELLQDVLALKEPYRTYCLQRWLETYDYEHGGNVKLKMSDKKTHRLRMEDGQEIVITPAGKNVARELAYEIMTRYGKGGQYHGIDRATGVNPVEWRAMHKDTKAFFEGYEFDFNEAYVYQVPYNHPSVEEDENTGEEEPNG